MALYGYVRSSTMVSANSGVQRLSRLACELLNAMVRSPLYCWR